MPPRTHPDPEVVPSAKRRRFSTKEKLRILAEAEQCTESGAIGALLRKEGLYSSHLGRWRALLKKSGSNGFADHKRGRKPDPAAELKALMLEHQKLQARLARAELIIDVQKKVSALLGLPTPSDESSS